MKFRQWSNFLSVSICEYDSSFLISPYRLPEWVRRGMLEILAKYQGPDMEENTGGAPTGEKFFLRPQWYCDQSTFFVFSIPKREVMEGGMISLSIRIYPAHLKSSNNWVHSLSIKAIVRWCVSNKKILIPPLWAPNHSYLQVMKPPSTGERLQDLSFEICLVPPNDSDNKEKT